MHKQSIFVLVLFLLPILILSACYTALPNNGSDLAQPSFLDDACADYDVVVIGGEPEGIAAAIAAAQSGQRTLLLAAEPALGGLFTSGMLNFLDISYTPSGGHVNTGIFAEFYRLIGSQDAFDVEIAKRAFASMVATRELLTVKYERTLMATAVDETGFKILGVQMQAGQKLEAYLTPILIDATADADVAAASGVAYNYMREDYGDYGAGMAVTLVLPLTNVDWAALQADAGSGRWGYAKSHSNAAWGFAPVESAYKPKNKNARMRGLNIGRQADGSVLINALQIFGVDPLDAASREAGIALGKDEAEHVLAWLRANMGGFEAAELGEFPTSLYIRESRHIQAEYMLTVHDVLESRIFADAVAFGSYPIDVQASSPVELGFVVGVPSLYSIPLRCLIPLEHKNLLVASKAAGYTSLAAGSARVVPIGMSVGQAAGVAASVALNADIPLTDLKQELYYKEVQAELKTQGVRFFAGDYASAYPQHPDTPALKRMVELGLVAGGYNNSFPLNSKMRERDFVGLVATAIQRVLPHASRPQDLVAKVENEATNDAASGEHTDEKARIHEIASRIYLAGLNVRILEWTRVQELLGMLFVELDQPELNDWLQQRLEACVGQPSRGQIYNLMADLFEQL